jgi:hypothetical protein
MINILVEFNKFCLLHCKREWRAVMMVDRRLYQRGDVLVGFKLAADGDAENV